MRERKQFMLAIYAKKKNFRLFNARYRKRIELNSKMRMIIIKGSRYIYKKCQLKKKKRSARRKILQKDLIFPQVHVKMKKKRRRRRVITINRMRKRKKRNDPWERMVCRLRMEGLKLFELSGSCFLHLDSLPSLDVPSSKSRKSRGE